MRRTIKVLTALPMTAVVVMASATTVGALTKAQLQNKTLRLSDMPTGWSIDNSAASSTNSFMGCLAKLQALGKPSKQIARAEADFSQGQSVPALQETLISGANEKKGLLPVSWVMKRSPTAAEGRCRLGPT